MAYHRWSLDELKSVASNYTSLMEFRKAEPKAYDAAKRWGCFDQITSHMIRGHRKTITFEECVQAASNCSSRREFQEKHPSIYARSVTMGWHSQVCQHMEYIKPGIKPYTKEECKDEAKKYNRRCDFMRKSSGHYARARMEGWLDEICTHMPKPKFKAQHKWDKESCRKEAKKYLLRNEFHRNSPAAYGRAWKDGYLDEICSHMYGPCDITQRIIYAAEFPDNSVYIGLTFNPDRRWKREITSDEETVYKHITESGQAPAFKKIHDYTDEESAKELEDYYIEKYRGEGWRILNVAKAGSLGSVRAKYSIKESLRLLGTCKTLAEYRKKYNCAYERLKKHGYQYIIFSILPPKCKQYTDEELLTIANEYSLRKELRKKNPTIYGIISKRGLRDKAFAHMEDYIAEKKNYISNEQIVQIASRFETRIDFMDKEYYAYRTAKRRGILDEVCKNMTKGRNLNGRWTEESVRRVASRYKSKKEFMQHSYIAYNAASYFGILGDVCSNMK